MNLKENVSNFIISNSLLLNHQQLQNETALASITINSSYNNNNNNININNEVENNKKQVESECELKVCAMFSICYPIIKNFENFSIDNNDNNNNNTNLNTTTSSIPKLTNPISWGDLTESESLYSSSPCSSVCSFEDDNNNTNSNTVKKSNKNKNNNSNNNNNNKNQSHVAKSPKKLFVGGIKFDDISDNEDLKKLRISKFIKLFQSFGLVLNVKYHWDKGYANNKVSQHVIESLSTPKKREKYIDKIRESLVKEQQDTRATPQLNFYVRLPSNK